MAAAVPPVEVAVAVVIKHCMVNALIALDMIYKRRGLTNLKHSRILTNLKHSHLHDDKRFHLDREVVRMMKVHNEVLEHKFTPAERAKIRKAIAENIVKRPPKESA